MSSSKSIVKTINHYKKSLEAHDVDEPRILHCIGQLYKLQVTVTILQETGVGRTVNGLCKSEAGDVRLAAKSLINKWKALVANESSTEEELARHSQEEVEDTRKHNSSGSLRKDSDRIKKERDNRSEHQHHRKTSRHDREGRHEERPKNHRSADSAAPSVEAKSIEKYHPQGDHAAVSGSTSKYTPGETSSSSEKPPRDRRSNGGDEKERKRSREHDRRHPDKERSSKRHKHESTKHLDEEKDDEDVEIDNTAGTSFADALAMMDGPSMPAKTSTTKSVTKTPTSNSSTSDAPKTKGSTYKPSSSSVSTSYSPAVAAPVNKANSKAGSSSSAYRASRPSDAGSGPPKLLAPSFKLAPLALDPDELKRDIMAASAPIVISNSYTPTSFLNPTNVAQVSAAISKNKRATGGAAASAETFEILQSKARTKVYSGNKCLQSVLSLHEMCIRVLQKNVDALEYTGGVPYDILEPVLLKCSANQLGNIEYYNPYLTEDTNDLWKKHAQRQFRGKKPREMESWKEMYERCQQEEQDRLSNLTESIKASQQTSIPLKQTKLAYMDRQAPHQGRRRAWGGGGGGGTSGGPSLSASLANRTSVNGTRMGFLTAGREVQAKRAPLMQKTLALMKKSIKR